MQRIITKAWFAVYVSYVANTIAAASYIAGYISVFLTLTLISLIANMFALYYLGDVELEKGSTS